MRELAKLDKIAYIRFASVYRSFETPDDFREAVQEVNGPTQAKKPDERVLGDRPRDDAARARDRGERSLHHHAESARRLRGHQGRQDRRRRLARARRRPHAEIDCLECGRRTRHGLDGLRHPGALQPPWAHTAVCHHVGRLQGQARSGSHARPESEIRARRQRARGRGHPLRARPDGGRGARAQHRLRFAHDARAALGAPQDRGDARRPQRPSGRAIAVDHRVRRRAATATAGARAPALC